MLLVSTPVNVCQMGINYVKQVSCNKQCAPLLFDVYVNELSELLNKYGTGGNLSGTIINHMLYADDICIYADDICMIYDICIVSLSSSGLQHLINICSD